MAPLVIEVVFGVVFTFPPRVVSQEKVLFPVIVSATFPVFFTTPSTREFQIVCVRESQSDAFSTPSHHPRLQYTTELTIDTERRASAVFLNIFVFISKKKGIIIYSV
jgi:hypothetical protein